jgi:hypothetical protein
MNRALENALRKLRERDWTALTGTADLFPERKWPNSDTSVGVTGGTASVSVGSATVTVADVDNLPTNIVGAFIQFGNRRGWWEIVARVNDTQLTIRYPYRAADGNLSGSAFVILYPRVALPENFRRNTALYEVTPDSRMDEIPLAANWYSHAWQSETSRPTHYSFEQARNDPNSRNLLLYPALGDETRIYQMVYVRDPGWFNTNVPATATWKREATADTDYLDWPDRHMDLFQKAALLSLFEEHDPERKYEQVYREFEIAMARCQSDDNPSAPVGYLSRGGNDQDGLLIRTEIENWL